MKRVNSLKEELAKFRNYELTEQTLLVWMQVGLTAMAVGIASGGVVASVGNFSLTVQVIEIFSMLLTLIGTSAILAALVQHRLKINYLHRKYNYRAPLSLASTFAAIIIALGISGFFANLLYAIYYIF